MDDSQSPALVAPFRMPAPQPGRIYMNRGVPLEAIYQSQLTPDGSA
jgi:hypothetical protein